MNFEAISTNLVQNLSDFGLKIIGAIAVWIIGRWLIKFTLKLMKRALRGQNFDATLSRYLVSIISILLQIILIIALLGFVGIETTSFAAIFAAAGIAIGAARSGLLANFAAGVFLVIFRPFQVGDMIAAAGVTGVVDEIGLFVTTINTVDNIKTIVGNNAIFADNIQNFSANPYRRVDLVAQLDSSVNHREAIDLLKGKLSRIPNVLSEPAPDVEILEFNFAGPVLAVRPYCNNEHYWQVYFDTNLLIRDAFGEAGYPAPEQHLKISQN